MSRFFSYYNKACHCSSNFLGTPCQDVPHILASTCWSANPNRPIKSTDFPNHLQSLGISGQRPEEPSLAIIDRRRATYLTYPHSSVSLDIETLCQAGYYYAGKRWF